MELMMELAGFLTLGMLFLDIYETNSAELTISNVIMKRISGVYRLTSSHVNGFAGC